MPYLLLTSLVYNGRSPIRCSIPDRFSQGLLDVSLCCRSSRLSVFFSLLHYLFLSPSSSSFLWFFLSVSCLVSFLFSIHGFKTNRSHDFLTPLLLPSDRLLVFTWNSLSLHHGHWLIGSGHLSFREMRQLFLISSVLRLHCETSHLPPQQSNWTSNFSLSRLNPLSNLVSPSGVISSVRSGAPRSDAIRSFRTVDLLDY